MSVVDTPLISVLGRQKQADLYGFKVVQSYSIHNETPDSKPNKRKTQTKQRYPLSNI